MDELKDFIRNIPDFPQPGILFRDITTLLKEPKVLQKTMALFTKTCQDHSLKPDFVAGIESRGFIFAPSLACQLNAGFIPIRKPGKLPGPVHSQSYGLEYGHDTLQIHQDAVNPGSKVLIVDDLLATGGTAEATYQLITTSRAEVIGFLFLIELSDLAGRTKLNNVPVHSLITY
jgi:adenine phosphoribosyltransferase